MTEIKEICELTPKIKEVKEIKSERKSESHVPVKPNASEILLERFEERVSHVGPSQPTIARRPTQLEEVEVESPQRQGRIAEPKKDREFYESVQGAAEDKKREYMSNTSQNAQDAQTRFHRMGGGDGLLRSQPALDNTQLANAHRWNSPADESKYYKVESSGIPDSQKKRKMPWEA
mgnify:CR=1 FL=1